MSKSAVVLKAKQLAKSDCVGVIELLSEYVKKNADDLEALALYQSSLAFKTIFDMNLNIDELLTDDGKIVFNSVPEELVLKTSELVFIDFVSRLYLSEYSDADKGKAVFGYLYRSISSLGKRLEDYNVMENQLEKFFKTLSDFEYGKHFYIDLAFIVDWKSKVSANILKFLVKKANSVSLVTSDEQIYNTYTKNMEKPLCSFEDKPYLSCEKLVVANIKSEEEKEFWKGYFALTKKTREEEYEEYQKIASNPKHPLYGLLSIGEDIHQSSLNACMEHLATSRQVAEMQIATNCLHVNSFKECDFKGRIKEAEQSFNTVRLTLPNKIKSMISKLFGKK